MLAANAGSSYEQELSMAEINGSGRCVRAGMAVPTFCRKISIVHVYITVPLGEHVLLQNLVPLEL